MSADPTLANFADRSMPMPTALSQPFWDAAARGELVIQRCTTCDRYEWTPIEACSSCYTETLSWKRVSGRGTLYSHSTVHRPVHPGFPPLYTVAIVELEEGPRMLTDIVGTEPGRLSVGMPVRVCFDQVAPMPLYHFEEDQITGPLPSARSMENHS